MSEQEGDTAVDISLLVCTYNRCQDLRELLETAIMQETRGEFSYEVIVVDNNSTDKTRESVKEFIDAGHRNVHYFFESRQGKSYALNTALEAAKGWAYVITDDDFILPANWLHEIHQAFRNHPEAAVISGKVLPRWQGEAPAWLTKDHWSAIAMRVSATASRTAGANAFSCATSGHGAKYGSRPLAATPPAVRIFEYSPSR